jgi:hypothetical protein
MNSDDIISWSGTGHLDRLTRRLPMVPGFRIPKGVLHQPHDVEEDLVVYDVFYPYLA